MADRRRRIGLSPRRMERRCRRQGRFRHLLVESLESRLLLALDFGDAPEWYPTTLAEDGARHEATGPRLGASRDTETNGVHSADASADADEAGVTFGSIRVGQLDATVTVTVQGGSGKLDAWIDFNGDGSWSGPLEHVFDNRTVNGGANLLTFDVPSWAVDGTTFARFRLSTAGDLGIGGAALDGEVEDHKLTIVSPTAASGIFASQTVIATGGDIDDPTSVFAVDLDDDGDMDVLAASRDDDIVKWYKNDGSEVFTALDVNDGAANGPMSVFAADVDGDGDTDVVSASRSDDDITWFQNDGSENFTADTIFSTATTAQSVFVADVDDDGDMDVLSAADGSDDEIAWHENDGSESFTFHSITTTANGARSVVAADVDKDGDMDVLYAAEDDDEIAWLDNNGSESFTYKSITTSANGARSVFAADMNGDGVVDVLSASSNDDKIAWYENDGSGTFTNHYTITTSANGASSVFATDVDGDGDMDVLSASENDDKIAWYENNGSQVFTSHTISTAADGAYSVFSADVDGDGDMDVISASQGDHKIAWYENLTERPSYLGLFDDGYFYLDTTGNGVWDKVVGGDTFRDFGINSIRTTGMPVIGDWGGDGIDDLGMYNEGYFYLDTTGNGVWDKVAGGDTFRDFDINSIRTTGLPVIGDWDGNGTDDLGMYDDGYFYLDTTGNGVWDKVAGGDTFRDFGINSIRTTGAPVIGDWDGNGTDDLGMFDDGYFYLDTTGNGVWDKVAGGDTFRDYGINSIRTTGAPVIGDWDGNGADNLGMHDDGYFYLDTTGNGAWDKVAGGDTFRDYGINSIRTTASPAVGQWVLTSPLLAAGGPAAERMHEKLTLDALTPIVDQAVAVWAGSGLDPTEFERLESVEVRIVDLQGARLGEALGTTITLDTDAAGYGWFVDATPWANEEFGESSAQGLVADPGGAAADRMDLLTVVLHELGHVLGHVDLDDILSDDVMNGWLPAGIRRM